MSDYKPCPKCAAEGAEQMSFTWWGGLIGPKILSHVKCAACGTQFNGKTGRDNTKGIVIYSIVVGLIVFGLLIVTVAAIIALTLAS